MHVSNAALDTETGIAAAFKLRQVFPPVRCVLVLPEVLRGARETRPRRLLLVVRRQLTAGSEEGVGGACGARDRRRRSGGAGGLADSGGEAGLAGAAASVPRTVTGAPHLSLSLQA